MAYLRQQDNVVRNRHFKHPQGSQESKLLDQMMFGDRITHSDIDFDADDESPSPLPETICRNLKTEASKLGNWGRNEAFVILLFSLCVIIFCWRAALLGATFAFLFKGWTNSIIRRIINKVRVTYQMTQWNIKVASLVSFVALDIIVYELSPYLWMDVISVIYTIAADIFSFLWTLDLASRTMNRVRPTPVMFRDMNVEDVKMEHVL